MNALYRNQVALLIRTFPYIARESCFALKGGTAINLFHRDLPRLSVDIDLVYLGFEPRDEAIGLIQSALERIAGVLCKAGISASLQGRVGNQKMIVSDGTVSIKVEPNYTLRGHLFPVEALRVRAMVEQEFGYAEMQLISSAELFGGKICAALDRQHPRDLFDISRLLAEPILVPDLMTGFVVMLLSHNRPPVELLQPSIKDQSEVFEKEFRGMTDEPFTYENHQKTLQSLLEFIRRELVRYKTAIIDFFSLASFQSLVLPPDFERLPAIQWKRQNLENLRTKNPKKFDEQRLRIVEYFESIEGSKD